LTALARAPRFVAGAPGRDALAQLIEQVELHAETQRRKLTSAASLRARMSEMPGYMIDEFSSPHPTAAGCGCSFHT
jgi:hypothetical protein